MAMMDGGLISFSLAQILSRGQHLAMQPGQMSISPFGGPDPLLFPCLQLPITDSSSADSDADQFSATSSAPCSPSCWAPVSKMQCASSPGSTRSCGTPAQRSLAAALNVPDSPPAAELQADAAADGCSTPRAQIIPAVRPPPGAPCALRSAARALLPDRPSGLCAHAGARLQQWLSQMELKLAVPPEGPEGPCRAAQDACLPPKITAFSARSTSSAQQRPALTVTAAGERAGGSSGGDSGLSRPGACERMAPTGAHPRRSSAGQLSNSSSNCSDNINSSSCPYRKKRTLDALSALDTLSLSAAGSASSGRAGESADAIRLSMRSSKRRSADGVSSTGAAASAAAAAAAVAGWQIGVCAAASPSGLAPSQDLPAPAFEILGLLSGPEVQR